jgi:hypothetical protein
LCQSWQHAAQKGTHSHDKRFSDRQEGRGAIHRRGFLLKQIETKMKMKIKQGAHCKQSIQAWLASTVRKLHTKASCESSSHLFWVKLCTHFCIFTGQGAKEIWK